MSSTPSSTVTVNTPPSKLDTILGIINLALQGLAAIVPGAAGAVALEQAFQRILTGGLRLYQAETGKPFDITLIPLEKPVE